jgi:hypothetical protein
VDSEDARGREGRTDWELPFGARACTVPRPGRAPLRCPTRPTEDPAVANTLSEEASATPGGVVLPGETINLGRPVWSVLAWA